MDNKCREILERGGVLTEEEWNLLADTFPGTDDYDLFNQGIRYYTTLYLPESRGYCTVLTGYDIDESEHEYGGLAAGDKEWISKLLHEKKLDRIIGVYNIPGNVDFHRNMFFPKRFEMLFYDLSCLNTFSTLIELEEYYAQYGIPDYLADPRNDPEFNEIIERGTVFNSHEYRVLLQYCNYIDYECKYSNIGYISNNVIDLGNGEQFMIRMGSERNVNRPWKPWYEYCLEKCGFRYVKDGAIVKDYDDDPELIIYKDEEC